ncbi:MAG: NFACT RNA binding domain-containing protein [Campylobacterota bacterium]|nr:NFACT RNA binding domain-containing protein [Campylobacterota bacterium]
MKYYILKQVTQFLDQYKLIKRIKRVDNNTISIEFEGKNIYYFDLSRSNGTIYKKHSAENIKKEFSAPFDVILNKRFNNCKIEKVYLRNEDKIINIKVQSRSAYKTQTTILQMEFTGKNTNIIILEDDDTIIEALRHVDEWTSIRVVKAGIKLKELEKPDFKYEIKPIDNIDQFLYNIYETKQEKIVSGVKKEKILQLSKQINKLTKILNRLEDVEQLKSNSKKLNEEASIIVGELYKFEGYEKNQMIKKSKDKFKESKKALQRAKNQYLEQVNLTQKIEFLHRMCETIENAKDIDEIEFYMPKKDKNQTKTKKANPYQSFFIDGYKIMLGRDERENIYLLQNSKASDFWFHLQGQPSSHVIVSNSKKTLPENIIEEAAKICARFSISAKGVFTVDFTQRRNVKIQTKANVLYNPYSSLAVKI